MQRDIVLQPIRLQTNVSRVPNQTVEAYFLKPSKFPRKTLFATVIQSVTKQKSSPK